MKTSSKLTMVNHQHFQTDIKKYRTTVTPFEVGAQMGHISEENNQKLKQIHKFCQPSIKFKKFTQNISAISVLSSYYIFNSRNSEVWAECDPITAPFPNN